ncbi:MAG: hypothetical protein PHT59_07540 [Candidatus Omnitrophica bacterium]|nr:hypothetical protein [Candidatus Omnitrophota bacterium]
MAKIEQKHLAGLIFRTSVKKEVVKDGQKKNKSFPTERPLEVTDIISQRDDGDAFHIVTADGRKYDIPKDMKAGATSNEDMTVAQLTEAILAINPQFDTRNMKKADLMDALAKLKG